MLKLKPDSGDLFFKDVAVNANDGSTTLDESGDPLDQFIVGDDGRMYLQSEHNLLEWQVTGPSSVSGGSGSIALVEVATWDYTKIYPGVGVIDAGVRVDGSTWLLLGNAFVPGRLVWFRPGGESAGSVNFPLRGATVIARGEGGTLYVCGQGKGAACMAFAQGADRPLWHIQLPTGRAPTGGALASGVLYVGTQDGKLFALGRHAR